MTLWTAAAVGVTALMLAAVFYALATVWRRILGSDGRLRFYEALRGQSLASPGIQSGAETLSGAHAVRRCVACAEHSRCDRYLASQDWQALREICPNSDYFEASRQA